MQHSGSTSTVTTAVATPKCCERNGLIYPDGGHRCWNHASADEGQLLDELDEWGIERGIPVRGKPTPIDKLAWPYGPNLYVGMRVDMLAWAAAHDLRYEARSYRGLDWLDTGRRVTPGDGRPTYTGRGTLRSWYDHVTLWSNAKHHVLVSQPYHLDDATRAELQAWGVHACVRVEIAPSGWYGGGTVWIALWSPRPARAAPRPARAVAA